MSDNVDEAQAIDPAVAFEELRRTVEEETLHLRSEMVIIRKGLEAAFEQFDNIQQPIDYGSDLVSLKAAVVAFGDALERLIEFPVFGQSPEYISRKIEAAGEGLIRTASDELNKQGRELERVTNNLARITKSAKSRSSQQNWVTVTLIGGIVLGVVLGLYVSTEFPVFG